MNQVVTAGMNLPAVPSFLTGAPPVDDGVRSGVGDTFVTPPAISIRGGTFRLVVDGAETPCMRREDSTGELTKMPALPLVIVRGNAGLHKQYFAKAYDPDAEPEMPDCYSYDGVRPSPHSRKVQAVACQGCPQNVLGSRTIAGSDKQMKACSDGKILAVMSYEGVMKRSPPDEMAGLMFKLRVSPSALWRSKEDRRADPDRPWSFKEYLDILAKYPNGQGGNVEVPVQGVVTRVFFDERAEHPKLQFKFFRFLTAEEYAYVKERAEGEDVRAITTEQASAVVAPAAALPGPAAAASLPAPEPAKAPLPAADADMPMGFGTTSPPAPAAAPEGAKRRGRPPAAPKAPETGSAAPPAQAAMPLNPVPPAAEGVQTTDAGQDADIAALVAQFSK